MKKLMLAALFLVVSTSAYSACSQSGVFTTCWDDNGNTYDVQRYGNTTYVDGHNYNTGSSWSSTYQTYGNTTYVDGTSADGNSWNETIQTFGDTRYISGTDSNGNSFNYSCNKYGCY